MRQQVAQSWGVFAILLSLTFLVVSFALSVHSECGAGSFNGYCNTTFPYATDATYVAIVAGMTFLLAIVVLALSRSIPPAPRPDRTTRPEDLVDFEDL